MQLTRRRTRTRAAQTLGKQIAQHPRAAARAATEIDWSALAKTAATLTGTPQRRRRTKRRVLAGVALAGATAAGIAVAARRK